MEQVLEQGITQMEKPRWKTHIHELYTKYYGATAGQVKDIPFKVTTAVLMKQLKEYNAKYIYDLSKSQLYQLLIAHQKNDSTTIAHLFTIGKQHCLKYTKAVKYG